MSAHSGLAFEVRALQRELRAIDLGPHAEATDAVLSLVRAARRITHLAHELAASPDRAGMSRDEVSLARITEACLAGENACVEQGDLEAAIVLIAKRAAPADAPGQINRVQRTLAAIADLPGVSRE